MTPYGPESPPSVHFGPGAFTLGASFGWRQGNEKEINVRSLFQASTMRKTSAESQLYCKLVPFTCILALAPLASLEGLWKDPARDRHSRLHPDKNHTARTTRP